MWNLNQSLTVLWQGKSTKMILNNVKTLEPYKSAFNVSKFGHAHNYTLDENCKTTVLETKNTNKLGDVSYIIILLLAALQLIKTSTKNLLVYIDYTKTFSLNLEI